MSVPRTPLRAFLLAMLFFPCAGGVVAQQVSEIQVAPVTMTMTVGEERTFLATAYDARGNPILSADIRWISTDLNVARVEWDEATPNVATVTAVASGIVQVEARIGTVRSQSVIQVQVADVAPAIEVLPDSVLPEDVSAASGEQIARIEPELYRITPACRAGGFVEDNLMLTTYRAVRGAERITVVLPDGEREPEARVAAYDVGADLAVLYVPSTRTGALATGADPGASDRVWVLGQPNCRVTTASNLRVASRTGPRFEIDQDLGDAQIGAPVVNRSGAVVGVATGGTGAVPMSRIRSLINEARANVDSGALSTVTEVAVLENHRYGSLVLRSDMFGASARVTPLESWHWPELQQESRLPFTFTGPMGRYRVELLANGEVQNSLTLSPAPGSDTDVTLSPRAVAGGGPEPISEPQLGAAGGGGGFPTAAAVLLGVAAAGGGAFLLFGGGGGGDGGGGGPPPPPGVGGISITIPIP